MHPQVELPYVEVWRSVRIGGDVKTSRSRRTLALAGYVVQVLQEHRERRPSRPRGPNGGRTGWRSLPRSAPNRTRTTSAANSATLVPGIVPEGWKPCELRHSFVSILSEHGLPIENISRLMGHGRVVTELVYRHELRLVLESGATVMGSVFALFRGYSAGDGDAA